MPDPSDTHSKTKQNNGRDGALTWTIPVSLPAAEKATLTECQQCFLAEGQRHVEALVRQLLATEGVAGANAASWATIIPQLASQAVALLSPPLLAAHGDIDVRSCVKIKRLGGGAGPQDSSVLDGVAFRKSVAHKRMRTAIENPRVVALAEGLEYHRSPAKLSSLDNNLLDQEREYLTAAVDRLLTLKPDVLLVERSVARYAQDILLDSGVTVVINVKRELLNRVASNLGGRVANTIEELSIGCVGTCGTFQVDNLPALLEEAAQEVQQEAGTDALPSPPPSPSTAQPISLMTFEGCPRVLSCSILLRGIIPNELSKVKRVLAHAVHAMYWNRLESALWPAQLTSAASSLGLEDPSGVLCRCRDIAHASSVAAAAHRGSDPIVWASPHLTIHKPPVPLEEGVVPVNTSTATVTVVDEPADTEQPADKTRETKPSTEYRATTPENVIHESTMDGTTTEEEGPSGTNDMPQLRLSISCRNPAKNVLCEPPHPHCMPFYQDGDLPLAAFIAAASPANRKCPQCNDGAALHLRSFLHGEGLVTLSSIRLPAGKELPDSDKGTVWLWLRPIKRGNTVVESARKVALPPEASCLSFAHLLALLLNTRHMTLDGINMQGAFVRYFGIGSTVLCLHFSTTKPYGVKMPGSQVKFTQHAESAWVQSEIKELTEEADEAFTAIGHALEEQVQQLKLSPDAAQPWNDTLCEMRKLFMKKVQAAIEFIDENLVSLDQSVQAFITVQAVWQLNQLRKLLGWIVLQWASSMAVGPAPAALPAPPFSALDTAAVPLPEHRSKPSMSDSVSSQSPRQGFDALGAIGARHARGGSDSLAHQFRSMLEPPSSTEANYAPTLVESTGGGAAAFPESPSKEAKYIPTGLVASRVAAFERSTSNGPEDDAIAGAVARAVQSHKLSDIERQQSGEAEAAGDERIIFRRRGVPSFTIDLSEVGQQLVAPLSPPQSARETHDVESMENDFERLAVQLGQLSRSISRDEDVEVPIEATADSGGGVRTGDVEGATVDSKAASIEVEVQEPMNNGLSQQSSLASAINRASPQQPKIPLPPSRLTLLLSQLLSGSGRKHHPLQGKVELSGRCLFTSGGDGACITVYDDEPTSIIAYFMSTREYKDYVDQTTRTILRDSNNKEHKEGEQTEDGTSITSNLSEAAGGPPAEEPQSPTDIETKQHDLTFDDLTPAKRAHVLLSSMQLDCQMTAEDSASPVGSFDVARLQTTAYYAPQFAELRRRAVAGGEEAFLASISRCRNWASRGGKSNVFFAKTRDDRYVIKQLSRSERQSFLEFAPDYFQYIHTTLESSQDSCLAKILGVYQVSVQYDSRPAPFGGRDGVMDVLVMENIFYGRSVTRIFDLKGSERDRYASDTSNNTAPGEAVVLLDENLKEMNQTQPTLVSARAYNQLQQALWADTGFLASLGVMDYSLLVGFDNEKKELVVGLIDFIRQYTWDKQVETWVKKTGILGGAGKDPTVISPALYCKRFRTAISSYFTVVPS